MTPAELDALENIARVAGVWRVDKYGHLYRRTEPCLDNGGSCCWQQDDEDVSMPVPEDEGGGWHWDELTSCSRNGVRMHQTTWEQAVSAVNALPALIAMAREAIRLRADVARRDDLLSKILGDEGPDIDAYLDGHAEPPSKRVLKKLGADAERYAIVAFLRIAARKEEWGDKLLVSKWQAITDTVWDMSTAIEREEHKVP